MQPLGHADAVQAWEHRLGDPTVRLVCGVPDEDGEPCRMKIGCILKGDDLRGPVVQTFLSGGQRILGRDRGDDFLDRTGKQGTAVWFLDDDDSAGWRGSYTARCVIHHRHLVDDRRRRRLQAAVREGLREVVFASADRR